MTSEDGPEKCSLVGCVCITHLHCTPLCYPSTAQVQGPRRRRGCCCRRRLGRGWGAAHLGAEVDAGGGRAHDAARVGAGHEAVGRHREPAGRADGEAGAWVGGWMWWVGGLGRVVRVLQAVAVCVHSFIPFYSCITQCRERWHNQLDPTICKDPWTPEEEQRLQVRGRGCGCVGISGLVAGRMGSFSHVCRRMGWLVAGQLGSLSRVKSSVVG